VIGQIDAGTRKLRDLRTPYRRRYELELHRRLAMPLAPLVFGTIAVALGSGRRRTRGLALIACATTVFGYYALLAIGIELASDGEVDPLLAIWAPNALFGAIGVSLMWRVARNAGE
jgi:lipopolysaccharide export LptBFGC system permease protein LptF